MSKKGFFTAISLLLAAAILVAAGVVFIPRLCHHCDNCGEFFTGTGYYANIVSNALSNLTGNEEKILCKDCAVKEHALAIATGGSVQDYKRPLFETDKEGE